MARSRRRGSPEPPQPVGQLVKAILERRNLAKPMRLFRIQAAWSEIVGEVAARRSWPTGLQRGKLHVAVADSVWLQEFVYLKDAILDKIRGLLSSQDVTVINFYLAAGAETPPERPGLPPDPAPAPDPDPEASLRQRSQAPEVTEALDTFEAELDRIEDAALRRAIRRAFVSHLLRDRPARAGSESSPATGTTGLPSGRTDPRGPSGEGTAR